MAINCSLKASELSACGSSFSSHRSSASRLLHSNIHQARICKISFWCISCADTSVYSFAFDLVEVFFQIVHTRLPLLNPSQFRARLQHSLQTISPYAPVDRSSYGSPGSVTAFKQLHNALVSFSSTVFGHLVSKFRTNHYALFIRAELNPQASGGCYFVGRKVLGAPTVGKGSCPE